MTSILLKYKYSQLFLSWILKNNRGQDDQLFTRGAAFANHPEPTIELRSPDCGPSGSVFRIEYTGFSDKQPIIPTISWDPVGPEVKELLLLCEDVDSPLGSPIVHGIFYGLSPTVTELNHGDYEVVKEDGKGGRTLKGGMKVGMNRRGTVYGAPRPLLNHGPHRYIWELITLKEKVDEGKLSAVPTKEELVKEVDGKVVGWGSWEGSYENKWV